MVSLIHYPIQLFKEKHCYKEIHCKKVFSQGVSCMIPPYLEKIFWISEIFRNVHATLDGMVELENVIKQTVSKTEPKLFFPYSK